MDGAFGRNLDPGEPARQALTNLTRTLAGVFALNVQDVVLYLEGAYIGLPIEASAPVGQPLNTALLVAIEDVLTVLREMQNSLQGSAIGSPVSLRATN